MRLWTRRKNEQYLLTHVSLKITVCLGHLKIELGHILGYEGKDVQFF